MNNQTNMNNITKITSINQAIELSNTLIEQNYNIILFLDIDDTVLSPYIGKKFVEDEICQLVDLIYSIEPNNLIFLTARDHDLKSYTKNQLNKSGLLHKGKYIDYNIICSPYDDNGNSTKGQSLTTCIESKYLFGVEKNENNQQSKKNWIMFIDDQYEHIESANKELEKLNGKLIDKINYVLMHYQCDLTIH